MTALAASLKSFRVGQRGWITLREAWHLFSPVDDEEEAFGELDDEGRKRLEDFVAAASYRSNAVVGENIDHMQSYHGGEADPARKKRGLDQAAKPAEHG